ncbi:hypothetical protein BDZ97DRAFT_1913406 [Flammula alnicola]|nr:hypothetical protein BDZ97DRAFT_1913406 [Flammula alnicola]
MSAPVKLPAVVTRNAEVLLVGFFANWALYGVLSLQVYLYYSAFPKDRLPLKATDVCSWFRKSEILDQVDTSWFSIPIMTGIIASVAQGFYCYRIAVITQSKYIAALIMLFSLFQLGGAIAIGVQTKRAGLFSRVFVSDQSLVTTGIWEAGSAACDLLIAGIMTYYLRRRDTGLKQTHDVISRIIRLTIETGSVTATLAIVIMSLESILKFYDGRFEQSDESVFYFNLSRLERSPKFGIFGAFKWKRNNDNS